MQFFLSLFEILLILTLLIHIILKVSLMVSLIFQLFHLIISVLRVSVIKPFVPGIIYKLLVYLIYSLFQLAKFLRILYQNIS